MNLIEAFEKKLVAGVDVKSWDKIIETIVSKIFFYREKVYKVYKYEKFFFGDFTAQKFRKDFYEEDFYWNNVMAPHVYLNLREVKKDFFIEMQKFDDNNNLTNLLIKKKINGEELQKIVKEQSARLKELTEEKRKKYRGYFNRKFLDMHKEGLEGDRNLMRMITKFVPAQRTDKIVDMALQKSMLSGYYKNFNSDKLSILIDNHADNVVFLNGQVQFIDVLPPSEEWRVGDPNFNICRIATDAAVLGSDDLAEAVYKNIEPMPVEIRFIYEIRSALIQAWCFYSTDKPAIAEKYLAFAEKRAKVL